MYVQAYWDGSVDDIETQHRSIYRSIYMYRDGVKYRPNIYMPIGLMRVAEL